MTEMLVPVAALLIAVLTFIATQLGLLRTANREHVQSMEERLKRCEDDKQRFQDRISYLERKLAGGAGL